MSTLTYEFEAFMKPENGIMAFSRDGYIPVNMEIDLETDGDNWIAVEIRAVEPHIIRKYADSDKLTGPLLISAQEQVKTSWHEDISDFVSDYKAPDDERLTDAWKEAM